MKNRRIQRGVLLVLVAMMTLSACHWQPGFDGGEESEAVRIERYDRIESHYLTTGDYAALQQMKLHYPAQTRMLIEDVVKIGRVSDADISGKFFDYYKDTVLQTIIKEVEEQYATIDDITERFNQAFGRLREELPSLATPVIYTQIGALDQSVVIGDSLIGVCLDKYLGADYPLYAHYYPKQQRAMMGREMIVPDCLVFYILSEYPPRDGSGRSGDHAEADAQIGKIQWIVNKAVGRKVFSNKDVTMAERYMREHKGISAEQLLTDVGYEQLSD